MTRRRTAERRGTGRASTPAAPNKFTRMFDRQLRHAAKHRPALAFALPQASKRREPPPRLSAERASQPLPSAPMTPPSRSKRRYPRLAGPVESPTRRSCDKEGRSAPPVPSRPGVAASRLHQSRRSCDSLPLRPVPRPRSGWSAVLATGRTSASQGSDSLGRRCSSCRIAPGALLRPGPPRNRTGTFQRIRLEQAVEIRGRGAVRSAHKTRVGRPRVRSPRRWSRRLTCPVVLASPSSSSRWLT